MTIKEITGRKEWQGNYGAMVTYYLELDDDSKAYMNRKSDSPAPEVGREVVNAGGKDNSGNVKVKYPDQGAQGSQTASNGKPDEAYWAKRNAQIISQSSRRDAIDATRLEGELGTFKPKTTEEVAKRIKSWEVKFEESAHKAEPPKENPLEEVPF